VKKKTQKNEAFAFYATSTWLSCSYHYKAYFKRSVHRVKEQG